MNKKIICIALTNRTNYSKLKTILYAIRNDKNLDFHIVLSSSILLERYGSSYNDIISDGFKIDKKIDCVLMNDSHEAMAKTIGLSVVEHATYFSWRNPDMLLIVGDRYDMLAPVIAAATMNIPIAHIQGGETSGTIDDVIRHVLTKFSKLHFVSTNKSAENLLGYGVDSKFVYNYGCPAVEYISQRPVGKYFDPKKLTKKFKQPIIIDRGEKYFLLMVHPDTTNKSDVNMDKVLEVISAFNMKTFIFYPNVDANNTEIVSSIAKYGNNNNFFRIRHMPLEDFIYTLAHCVCMIGNSSSGIREAASFGVPVVNIGFRQKGRERNKSTIDIGSDYELLEPSIKQCIDKTFSKENIYFKPDCSKKITEEIISYINNNG